jgi:MoaA/NifB/PqqE/SkfB family radical SAM enzyme
METENNKSFCMMAWDGLAIRPNGLALPCCRFSSSSSFNKNSNIHGDPRISKEWEDIRKKMIAGEKLSECSMCYMSEKEGTISMRQNHTKDSPIPPSTLPYKVSFLEVAFSNLCNLACVSCSSTFSSSWAAEDFRAKRHDPETKALMQHNYSLDDFDFSKVKILKIIGGEPFMDQDRFINLLKKMDLSKLQVNVCTNGTVLPNGELKVLLEKTKKTNIAVSIDGVGLGNEWYRWPTKMAKVEENMDFYESWKKDNPNITLSTKTLVSIYNIWNLAEFVLYLNNRRSTWTSDFDWIRWPSWQTISLVPDDHKIILKEKLRAYASEIKGKWPNTLNPFLTSIERLDLPKQNTLDVFRSKTLELAKERNLDVFEMVPAIRVLFED